MLSPFRFYELYNAMSLHFKPNTSYDFFKYDGKTRVTENSFLAAKGKYFYEKNARKLHNEPAAIAYLASNFAEGCKWVGDLKQEPYDKFISYRDALYYKFEQDVEKYTNGVSPYQQCMTGSTESWIYLILINVISNGVVFAEYDIKYKDNILWEDLKTKLETFSPFVVYCFGLTDQIKLNLRNIVRKVRSQIA